MLCANIAKFHRTDTDTDFLAGFRTRKSTYPTRTVVGRSATLAVRSACPLVGLIYVGRALFLTRICVVDARIYTCTVHDKLSCTRLQITR